MEREKMPKTAEELAIDAKLKDKGLNVEDNDNEEDTEEGEEDV